VNHGGKTAVNMPRICAADYIRYRALF